MKTKYTVALATAASFALGALAVQGLHAQAKPPGYVVVEVAVTDKDGYAKEFIPPAAKAIEEGGAANTSCEAERPHPFRARHLHRG
jgi:hypothetical protein